jgi:flagellar motor switch protein FliN/FliY
VVDEFLNQDEIEALLSGGSSNSSGGEAGKGVAGSGTLKPDDISVLAEVVGVIAGAASNVIGMLAGHDVTASLLDQLEIPQSEMAAHVGSDKVFAYSMQLSGLNSPAQLMTTERGALTLADLMMGGDAQDLPSEANDLYLSASQEGLSQVMGSALTSLSGLMAGLKLAADDSSSNLGDASSWIPFASEPRDMPIWVGRIELTTDGVDLFVLNIALPLTNALDLVERVRAAMTPEEPPQEQAAPASRQQASAQVPQQQAAGAGVPVSLPPRPQGPPVDARPVEFAQLGGADYAGVPANIDLIVDIPVRITVELGRPRKTIGEVLALGPGSVVELNKMAGEPVDVLVNGKLIARGEVVVIDESFGIRVTEVVSRAERIRSMGV